MYACTYVCLHTEIHTTFYRKDPVSLAQKDRAELTLQVTGLTLPVLRGE